MKKVGEALASTPTNKKNRKKKGAESDPSEPETKEQQEAIIASSLMNDFSLYSVYVVRPNNGTTENLGVFAGYLGAPNIKTL